MAVVVIDPGHGGTKKIGGSSPNNATSPSGLLEKNLTLAVARHAEKALIARGHNVRLTRTTDVNLGLADRAAVAKGMQADVFVSIHFNGFGDATVQGTETWVHLSASPRSRDLAGCIQRSVLQATRHRDRGVQAKVLGVLDATHHAKGTAACLAELSFITTTAEDLRLRDASYLLALGEAVAGGVQDFVDRQESQPLTAAAAPRARDASSPVSLEAQTNPAEQVVVLMLEGHSVDHVLGSLRTQFPSLEPVIASGAAALPLPTREPALTEFQRAPAAVPVPAVIPSLRARTALVPAAVTAGSPIVAKNQILADVRQAIEKIPKKNGKKTAYAGPVISDGDDHSHVQGLAGYKDFFLVTHSDKSKETGRILVVDRRAARQKLVAEFRLPKLVAGGPALFHAGGCQLIGDVLAVPSESGRNSSVVAFFDVSDPMNITELHASLRIPRHDRDAAAVGITAITRDGRDSWICAAYDSGSVDFYESPDLPGGAAFSPLLGAPIKVAEKDHQALLLFTDESNRIFAAGLNRGNFPYFDKLVLYEVDLVGRSMKADPDRSYSTGGATRLRWGSGLELIGTRVALHCTTRNYGASCKISSFDAGPAAGDAPMTKAARRARKPRKHSIKKRQRPARVTAPPGRTRSARRSTLRP